MMDIYKSIIEKKKNVCVIGLGYVGMPLFLSLSKRVNTIGYDVDKTKIDTLKLKYPKHNFVTKIEDLINCSCYIIAVPTPINSEKNPDLACVIEATKSISTNLRKDSIVIYESTVYPGVTENICKKILVKNSKLEYNKDFYLGYSPERINPGDGLHSLKNTTKIISASNDIALDIVEKIYKLVVDTVYKVSNIKTAEAIKLLENTQRDLNIALMNEFRSICEKDNIDIYEIIEGANTKWNFYNCYPGLVGGHCISVDPYYYIYYAKMLNSSSELIENSRKINESMVDLVIQKIHKSLKCLHRKKKNILVIGLAYKPNTGDIRNSKIINIIKKLNQKEYNIFAMDERVSKEKFKSTEIKFVQLYKINKIDLIIFATLHDEYKNFSFEEIQEKFEGNMRIIEFGNHYKRNFKEKSEFYWNL